MAKKTFSQNWSDYELLDAGNESKLERWGDVITIRPEVQAYFKSGLPMDEWKKLAHLEFLPKGKEKGKWIYHKPINLANWKIQYDDLTFILEPTKFKHVGLFPEQAINWELIKKQLAPEKKMLNLFAYTGAASIVGKSTGAEVTHVDAVKQLISWARLNMEASELKDIRWMHEDALKFAKREVKRGNTYDLIVMDPPAWGIGAKNEKWKIEQKLEELIALASQLLNTEGLLILNTYSPRVNLADINTYSTRYFPEVEVTELWKKARSGKELFFGHLLRAWKR